ncbi:hypothetical protein, partial [Staphylococcus chromogenes]|uniref:hypothetical protein n=1 Tax=Staphylococcus chromogenes TaxID=46126 RepID=UPI003BF5DA75
MPFAKAMQSVLKHIGLPELTMPLKNAAIGCNGCVKSIAFTCLSGSNFTVLFKKPNCVFIKST